jgi:hypothetical protein
VGPRTISVNYTALLGKLNMYEDSDCPCINELFSWELAWATGVRSLAGDGNFSLRHRVQTCSGSHPASYPTDSGESFPGEKRSGRETNHSPPSSA